MTSKIIVNNIEADAGVSTVTFGSDISANVTGNVTGNLTGDVTGNVNSTGVTTVTTLNVGTGASISSPASNVLTLGTNNTERVRINSTGHVGILSTLSIGTNTQVTSSTDLNPVITVGSATTSRLVWGTPGSDNYRLNLSGGGALVFGVDGDSENFGIEGHQTGVQHLRYLTIDNYGRVTKPYQPYARVYYRSATNLNYTAGNTYTIVFNSVDANVGGHYSTSNGRFTCPVAGTYLVMTALQFSTSVQNSWAYNVLIRVNNSAYAGVYQGTPAATSYESGEAYAIVNVNANDYIDVGVSINSSIGHEVGPGDVRNYLMIYLLG